jgi:hypothetical protein
MIVQSERGRRGGGGEGVRESEREGRPAVRSEGEQGRNFTPPSPPWGPVGSWDGMEVIQGVQVQVGHRATWFGGGQA